MLISFVRFIEYIKTLSIANLINYCDGIDQVEIAK